MTTYRLGTREQDGRMEYRSESDSESDSESIATKKKKMDLPQVLLATAYIRINLTHTAMHRTTRDVGHKDKQRNIGCNEHN